MKQSRLAVLICLTLVMALAFGATVSAELVNGRFTTTRKITVEIYDRSNPGGTPPEDNYWTDWIKKEY